MNFARPATSAFVLAAALGATFCANAADAPDAACEPEALSPLHQRIVAKAQGGVDELRRYIFTTRAIHQLYMPEVVAWLDARRVERSRCATASAQDAATPKQ